MLGKGERCSTTLDFDAVQMIQYFADACRDEDYKAPRMTKIRGTPPMEVSPHLVYEVLRKTGDTAPGKDGIFAWVFRENAHNLTFPVKHIIDHCLAQGKFPACLKISKVIRLPKVATIGSLNDWRPLQLPRIWPGQWKELSSKASLPRTRRRWLRRAKMDSE